MKKYWLFLGFICLLTVPGRAQQIMYANLKSLMALEGDTVSTLRVEKRTKNQIYLTGGGDYRIEAADNPGLCKYLRSRCYAVRVDSSWYVNCRKMRYKRYRFGQWYAPALWVQGKLYFSAQPLGQVAASHVTPAGATKLGGDVGNALAASGLVNERVYYELDPTTGRCEFVGKEKMLSMLQQAPLSLRIRLEQETSELAEVIHPYLLYLVKSE